MHSVIIQQKSVNFKRLSEIQVHEGITFSLFMVHFLTSCFSDVGSVEGW